MRYYEIQTINLGTKVGNKSFARPYQSWKKGSIENFNKLIGQYVSKKSDFNSFFDRQLLDIQKKLNRQPREKLNFDSPKDVFFNYLNLCALTT